MKSQNNNLNDIPEQFKQYVNKQDIRRPISTPASNCQPCQPNCPPKSDCSPNQNCQPDFKDTLFILLIFIIFLDNM